MDDQFADFRGRVQRIVDGLVDCEGARLRAISPDLEVLTEVLRQFMAGGKRLRPAFCYWGWRGAGGSPEDDSTEGGVIEVAASQEFLQACALIHDDVMDASETRRGRPSVHHQFANLHRGEQWLGTPETFGVSTAILLGDLCLSWADQCLTSAALPADVLARAKHVYDEMRTELMAGQYLDLLEQALGGGSVERARLVTQYKSAKYTIERPLHLGAALAGAPPEVFAAYTGFGLPLGEAFQLRDDVLGVFGDPAQTGKPAGDDLREGKRTVLVALALELAPKRDQQVLRQLLGDPALSSDGVQKLREVITDSGATRRVEERISELLEQSLAALEQPSIDSQARVVLAQLAHAATDRKD